MSELTLFFIWASFMLFLYFLYCLGEYQSSKRQSKFAMQRMKQVLNYNLAFISGLNQGFTRQVTKRGKGWVMHVEIIFDLNKCTFLGHKWFTLTEVNNCYILQCRRCNTTKTGVLNDTSSR